MGTLDDLKASVGLAGIENARVLSDALQDEKAAFAAAVDDKERAIRARDLADAKQELEAAVRGNRARFKLIVNGWTGI